MKIGELIAELQCFDSESKVYIHDEEGDCVEVEHVFRIKDGRPPQAQDIILTEKF